MSTLTDSEIKRLAKSAGLPKIMWDTVGYREKLAVFVEHARAVLVEPPADPLPAIELRYIEGSLDEIVSKQIHIERMSANHWWMEIQTKDGRVTVDLMSDKEIRAIDAAMKEQGA